MCWAGGGGVGARSGGGGRGGHTFSSDNSVLVLNIDTVNVLKFRTLYFILFCLPKPLLLCTCFLKILSGMANSVDTERSSLIWVYTVCICHFVRNLGKHMGLT